MIRVPSAGMDALDHVILVRGQLSERDLGSDYIQPFTFFTPRAAQILSDKELKSIKLFYRGIERGERFGPAGS